MRWLQGTAPLVLETQGMTWSGPGDPGASLGPWCHGPSGMLGPWVGSWHPSTPQFGEVGTDPSMQGSGILQSHSPSGWDGGCPHCGAMGLMCLFPEPEDAAGPAQGAGGAMRLAQLPSANSCLQRRGRSSRSAPRSLLSPGFYSTYVRVKQFIKADRNKVGAQQAPAPPGQRPGLFVRGMWAEPEGRG